MNRSWHLTAAWCAGVIAMASSVKAAEEIKGDLAYARGDYAQAAALWAAAAAAGDASAMSGMGVLYDTGHGVPQNFAQALDWYRRSAQAGNVSAMLSTAAMYDNGRGTAVNRPEAIRWYTLAAGHGNGRAAYDLGVIYRDGDGVPRNRTKAIGFFQQAAARGIVAGRTNLAALGAPIQPGAAAPLRAASVAADPGRPSADAGRFDRVARERGGLDGLSPRAVRNLIPSLDKRARNGDGVAQYDLGFAYERGLGVPADPVAAYVNYLNAAASKNATVNSAAVTGAAVVGNQLTPEQHAAARMILLGGP